MGKIGLYAIQLIIKLHIKTKKKNIKLLKNNDKYVEKVFLTNTLPQLTNKTQIIMFYITQVIFQLKIGFWSLLPRLAFLKMIWYFILGFKNIHEKNWSTILAI